MVVAGLQEMIMGMGDGDKNLSESLGAVQTDFDPPETQATRDYTRKNAYMRAMGHRLPKVSPEQWWVLQSSACPMQAWCRENCQQAAQRTRTFETPCGTTFGA